MKDRSQVGLSQLFILVSRLIWQYRRWLLVIITAMLVETLMSLASPWPLKIIIDHVVDHQPLPAWLSGFESLFRAGHEMRLTLWASVAMIVFTVLGGLAGYLVSYFTESVAQYMANDLRKRIYHHLQYLSFAYYDTHQVGKLISTITTDVATIQDFASTTMISIVVDLVTLAGMFLLMLSLNWDFALIAVSMAPFVMLFVVRFRRAVKKATHAVRRDQSEMLTIIQQGLESIRAVNAFGRQALEEEKLNKISRLAVEDALRARRIKSFISPVMTITVSLCTAFVLWRGASLILAGAMTIGTLTVFIAYLGKFFSPVKDLAKMTGNIAQASVAAERIQQILNASQKIPEKQGAYTPGQFRGHIRFEDVDFFYKRGIPVLKNIDLEILPGERIGICGPTGGGKTTIACLIPRFYDPTAGRILIDGTDVREFTLEGLRKQIGFVLQDTMLFYGTIRENIAYGQPGATEKEIREAAIRADADEFISSLPNGYQTLVGERGMTLSSGQRQRIGIARAIIRNAPILILDEPTASLDAESEKMITKVLEGMMTEKTVITITHRLNTIINADRIFVIKEGQIVETGSHSQLLALGGVYADLFYLQHASA